MRAKQSSIASGIYSCSGALTAPLPICTAIAFVPPSDASRVATSIRKTKGIVAPAWESLLVGEGPLAGQTVTSSDRSDDGLAWAGTASNRAFPAKVEVPPVKIEMAHGEGLLHDVRNLMNALGLYTDLLSSPGVLKPEHIHYAGELRLLSTLSGALIERLTRSLLTSEGEAMAPSGDQAASGPDAPAGNQATEGQLSLREIVECCSGLLSRVAGGRTIELSFGPAASVLVKAQREDVERILVNLVRNSAAALDVRASLAISPPGLAGMGAVRGTVREMAPNRTSDQTPDAIRIGVGQVQDLNLSLEGRALERVRLTVEDSGCGMALEQLDRMLRGVRALSRGSRGIGFRVVRELITGAGGDVSVMSSPGVGTRVQMEWLVANTPVANTPVADTREVGDASEVTASASGDGRWTA